MTILLFIFTRTDTWYYPAHAASDKRTSLYFTSLAQHLDAVPELAHLLLVVVSRQHASRAERNRNRSTASSLDDARDR
jgi:hypothetical protein